MCQLTLLTRRILEFIDYDKFCLFGVCLSLGANPKEITITLWLMIVKENHNFHLLVV